MDRVLRVAVGLLIVTLLPLAAGGPVEAQESGVVDWGDLSTAGLDLLPDTPDPTTPMVFLLGLKSQQDRAALARAVSDPRSAAYGDHRDLPTLVQQVSASTTTVEVVQAFFAGEGLEAVVDPTRTYAQVIMELADAERIFATTWAPFAFPDESMFSGLVMLYPTSPPVLPGPLGGLVDRVHGAVILSEQLSEAAVDAPVAIGAASSAAGSAAAASPASSTAAGAIAGGSPWRTGTPSGCADALAPTMDGQPLGLSPSQLLDAYGIDDLHDAGLRGEGMRVAIVENMRYDPSDLAVYRSCFGLDDAFPVVDHEQGELAPADDVDSPEAILDLAVMSFAAPKLDRVDMFMVGDDPALSDADPTGIVSFLRMFTAPIDAAVQGAPAPHVVSASYGICETSPMSLRGATALTGIFDQVFALAAAAGISYVVSTGDDGSSACNQFAEVWGEPAPEQAVQYPASSAYVTAVGGTNLYLDPDNEIASSGAWNDTVFVPVTGLPLDDLRAGGTGGVSTLIDRPWFQDAVNASPTRSVPDVAMFADELPGYLLYTDGWTSVGGTSAAAPLFGGVVALLDQRAVATQQPTLGFVAPLMYELGTMGASSLLDITIGNNIIFPEPEYGLTCCAAGPGYDLATGWGSPLADRMLLELDRPVVELVARQLEPAGTAVELTASTASGIGAALRFEWDIDGDGTIDQVTDTPSITVDYATGGATVQGTSQDGTAVLGSSLSRTVAPAVAVTTSLGRTGLGATTLTLSLTATPARLAFVG